MIAHTAADGTTTDITEGVQALYDLVIGSMDWGSGFLSVEEALPVAHLARTCGFAGWEEAQRYVDQQTHSAEQFAFTRGRATTQWGKYGHPVPHDHVFSHGGPLPVALLRDERGNTG